MKTKRMNAAVGRRLLPVNDRFITAVEGVVKRYRTIEDEDLDELWMWLCRIQDGMDPTSTEPLDVALSELRPPRWGLLARWRDRHRRID